MASLQTWHAQGGVNGRQRPTAALHSLDAPSKPLREIQEKQASPDSFAAVAGDEWESALALLGAAKQSPQASQVRVKASDGTPHAPMGRRPFSGFPQAGAADFLAGSVRAAATSPLRTGSSHGRRSAAPAPATPAAAGGVDFEGCLKQLDSVRQSLLEQHQRELELLREENTRLEGEITSRDTQIAELHESSCWAPPPDHSPRRPPTEETTGHHSSPKSTIVITQRSEDPYLSEPKEPSRAHSVRERSRLEDLPPIIHEPRESGRNGANVYDRKISPGSYGFERDISSATGGYERNTSGMERGRSEGSSNMMVADKSKAKKAKLNFAMRDVWLDKYRLSKDGRDSTLQMHTRNSDGFRKKANSDLDEEQWVNACMIHPTSVAKTGWDLGSILFMVIDVLFVPVYTFFGLRDTMTWMVVDWCSMVFWTLDILVSFLKGVYINGILEMRFSVVAPLYARSWLSFDMALVLSHWAVNILYFFSGDPHVKNTLRHIQLVRLLRIFKLGLFVQELGTYAPEGMILVSGLIQICMVLFISVHFLGCAWFGAGVASNIAWVHAYDYEDEPFRRQYMSSINWALSQFHGGNLIPATTTLEHSLSMFTTLVGHLLMAVFIAKMTQVVLLSQDHDNFQVQQVCRRHLARRNLSPELNMKLRKHVTKSMSSGWDFRERLEHEAKILEKLPLHLQMDLHEELRRPRLQGAQFLVDLGEETPRTLRRLCHEALSLVVSLLSEPVFGLGDACTRMLFVESGMLHYNQGFVHMEAEEGSLCGPTEWVRLHTNPEEADCMDITASIPTRSSSRGNNVHRGKAISEGALWTKWQNCGDLVAEEDCLLFAMDIDKFTEVICQSESACHHGVKYAKHFVWRLNRLRQAMELSDLLDFKITRAECDRPLVCDSAHDHLVFVSHAKEEAGAEATLIEEAMVRIIKTDPSHCAHELGSPIFLDSENLSDLSLLKDHVRRSHNLVLLLTPQVLLRPWCLVEIITALRAGVRIVPVEIQKNSRMKFVYPQEDFYQGLRMGEGLSPRDVQLLKSEGIELEDLDDVRRVFQKIALPFSPHKSGKIREAEIASILDRCALNDGGCVHMSDSRHNSQNEGKAPTKEFIELAPLP